MDDAEWLRDIAASRSKSRRQPRESRLSDTLGQLMEKQIAPKVSRFEQVREVWNQLLPVELAQACRIVEIRYGQLTVEADNASYRYELSLCSSQLLEQLQIVCPRAGIRTIKVVI